MSGQWRLRARAATPGRPLRRRPCNARKGRSMHVEAKLTALGLSVPDLAETYARSTSGARFVSHKAVGQLLYLSGTVPYKDGAPYLTGVLGADLTVDQGYEAARH